MRPRCSLAGVPFLLTILVVLIVLVTTAPSSTAPSSTAPSAPSADEKAKDGFTLAVVRRDSIARPFATYDGKGWKNAWPDPALKVTAPIALADVPKKWWSGRDPIMKWTLWPIEPADGASRTIETVSPTIYPAHCEQGLGLRTTYSTQQEVPPPRVQPYPKAGLAVSAGATAPTIEPIQIVDVASSSLATPIARAIVDEVLDEEKRKIGIFMRAGEGWKHPYNDEERKEIPLRLEAMYKVSKGLGDRDVFYFEGLKYYAIRDPEAASKKPPQPKDGKEPCDLVTFVSGWLIGREDELLKDKDNILPKSIMVAVTSCDFAAANIMLPLGVVRVKEKAYWAVQRSSWTHEYYSVLDITDDKFILAAMAASGGTCRRPRIVDE